jgi:DNA-directed RNA polymerase specialized sigma24 family protein
MVFAYLSRTLGAGPHVEDLAQEVFLRACRGLAAFDANGAARPSTWLLTIASRVAIDARRKRHVPTAALDADLGVTAP